jgi:hypothetical protein
MKLRGVVRYSLGLRCGFEFLIVTEEQRVILRQVCAELANASGSLPTLPAETSSV